MKLIILLLLYFVINRPIQLIRPTKKHDEFIIVEEGINYLRSIEGPIAVISAVGTIHSGKSFLLNQLALPILLEHDKNSSEKKINLAEAFDVGYTINPQTSGIWTYSKPIKYKGVNIIFLDTEGLFSHASATIYDAKLFAITALLSSEIIYNTVKFIDNQQIEALETLIRRTNLFGVRTYARNETGGYGENVQNLINFIHVLIPPYLSWVVQDFMQDLNNSTAEDWLYRLLKLENSNITIKENMSIRKNKQLIESFFKYIDCVTIPIPINNTSELQKLDLVEQNKLDREYIDAIDKFRNRLFERAIVNYKRKGGQLQETFTPMLGTDLALLLEFIVNSANKKSTGTDNDTPFPNFPDAAKQFVALQMKLMRTSIIKILERDLNEISKASFEGDKILSVEEFTKNINRAVDQARNLWKTSSRGIQTHHAYDKYIADAQAAFNEESTTSVLNIKAKYCEMLHNWCIKQHDMALAQFETSLYSNDTSMYLPHELVERINALSGPITNNFFKLLGNQSSSECCGFTQASFVAKLREKADSVIQINNARIAKYVESIFDGVIIEYKTELPQLKVELQAKNYHQLQQILRLRKNEYVKLFNDRLNNLNNTDYAAMSIITMKKKIDEINKQVIIDWENTCIAAAKAFIKSVQSRTKSEIMHQLNLPCDEEIVDSVVANHVQKITKEFEKRFLCYDSPKGTLQFQELELQLEKSNEWIKEQNIEAVKNLHSHVLDELKTELIQQASKYYIVNSFREYAKKKAFNALIDDQLKVDANFDKNKLLDNKEKLLKKGAEKFANTLIEAERLINGMFMLKIICTLLITILISKAISDYDANCGIKLLICRVFFSVPPMLILYNHDFQLLLLNKLFIEYWMNNWSTLITVLFSTFIAMILSSLCEITIHKLIMPPPPVVTNSNPNTAPINIPHYESVPYMYHRNTTGQVGQCDMYEPLSYTQRATQYN